MHFVTGGAFNGKRAFVKQMYGEHVTWISAYKDLLKSPNQFSSAIVALEGVEQFIRKQLLLQRKPQIQEERKKWNAFFDECLQWENQSNKRQVIWIGVDLTKGIVPVEPLDRMTRDLVGYCYQDLVSRVNRFDYIWYGMAERLK